MNKCVLSSLLLLNWALVLLRRSSQANSALQAYCRRVFPLRLPPLPFDKGLSKLGYVEGQNVAIGTPICQWTDEPPPR